MRPNWRVVRSGAALIGAVLGLSGVLWADQGTTQAPASSGNEPRPLPHPSQSRQPLGAGERQGPERIKQLEARLTHLEGRLAEMERRFASLQGRPGAPTDEGSTPGAEFVPISTSTGECVSPYFVDTRGIRRVDVTCLIPPLQDSCDPPYTVDAEGIRRAKPHCTTPTDSERHSTAQLAQPLAGAAAHPGELSGLPSQTSADDAPKKPEPGESTAPLGPTPNASGALPEPPGQCDPPWQIDTRGVRRLRPWCVDTR